MEPGLLTRLSGFEWRIEPKGKMRVPGVLFATEALLRDMDPKVHEQVSNVAALPGIEEASFAMPDAHWGYGFPIGGVAAFDADRGGVISAGGVGFDISCGVRNLHTGLTVQDVLPVKEELADALLESIPAGVGSTGGMRLDSGQMDAMLAGGARWAVEQGYGTAQDLQRIEDGKIYTEFFESNPIDLLLDIETSAMTFVPDPATQGAYAMTHTRFGVPYVSHYIDPVTETMQQVDWSIRWRALENPGWIKWVWDAAHAGELTRLGVTRSAT